MVTTTIGCADCKQESKQSCNPKDLKRMPAPLFSFQTQGVIRSDPDFGIHASLFIFRIFIIQGDFKCIFHHIMLVIIFTTHLCNHGITECPPPPVWAKLTKSRGDNVNTVPPLPPPCLGWFEVRNFVVAMKITGRGQRTTDLFMNLYFRTYLKLDVKVPRNCVGPNRFNLSIKHNDSVHISLI